MINSTRIENVTEFVCLGSLLTWDNDCSKEIKRRIARATGAMVGFKKVWNSMCISVRTKLSIIRSCVMSVLLYACETWTLRKRDMDSLMGFEMKCYWRILHIHWQQKITNVEIRQRLDIKKNMERNLKLFEHICKMDDNRLVKNVVFRFIDGLNRRGRPRSEWMDNIKEWGRTDAQALSNIVQDRSE